MFKKVDKLSLNSLQSAETLQFSSLKASQKYLTLLATVTLDILLLHLSQVLAFPLLHLNLPGWSSVFLPLLNVIHDLSCVLFFLHLIASPENLYVFMHVAATQISPTTISVLTSNLLEP